MAFEKIFANLVQAFGLLLFFTMSPASAQTFDPQGGPGGGGFKAMCPGGQYLIGTNAHYGAAVDHISLICGTVNSDGTVGNVWNEPAVHGGNGGGPVPKTSCENSEVIHGMGLLTGPMPPHTVIRLIIFNCVSTTTAARHNLDIGVAPLFPTMQQDCKTGQAAIGIQGRAGEYLDAAGLLCGPFTIPPPPVIPPAPNPLGDCVTSNASPDQRLYQLHNDGGVWVRNNQACAGKNCAGGWNLLDNNRATVQIASYCELYQLRNNGVIQHYNGQKGQFANCLNPGIPCDANWDGIDGNPQTRTIAVSAAYHNSNLPPFVYQMHKDGTIWRRDGNSWDQIDSNPATVSIVGGATGFYKLHGDGKIYRWCGPTPVAGCSGWALLDQSTDPTIMITAGNGLYQLRRSGDILHYADPANTPCKSMPCPNWDLLSKDAALTPADKLDKNSPTTMIKSGFNGFYQLQKNGWVSQWVRNAWQILDKHSDTVAITAGQQLFEVRSGGNIFRYNLNPCRNQPVGCDAAFDQFDQNASSEGVVVNGNLAMH